MIWSPPSTKTSVKRHWTGSACGVIPDRSIVPGPWGAVHLRSIGGMVTALPVEHIVNTAHWRACGVLGGRHCVERV